MGLKEQVGKLFKSVMIERPAARQGVEGLEKKLAKSGELLAAKLEGAAATPKNEKTLRHVIAIERWGQQRLRVGLGEDFVQDESQDYSPKEQLTWDELKDLFRGVRAETLQLTHDIKSKVIDPTTTVRHNQFGAITLQGWLAYLNVHANTELRRVR